MKVLNKTFIKSIFLLTQVTALLGSIIVFCFSFYNIFMFLTSYDEYVWMSFYMTIILPFTLMCIISYMIVKSLKTSTLVPNIFKSKKLNIGLFSIYQILCIAISFFIGMILLNFISEKPPKFFRLNDPQATYKIIIQNHQGGPASKGLYYLRYDSTSRNKDGFCTNEYEKDGETHCRYDIIIGKSTHDLSRYLNLNVVIKGDFDYGNKQCIAKKCTSIENYAVFNIDEIKPK